VVPVARADPEVVVAVDTPDLGRAVRFYRDALKCEVLEDRSPEFVMVALGPGTGLCIDAAPAGAAPLPAPRLILRVDDVPARERDVAARGLALHGRGEDRLRPWFSVVDPDGREVIFQGSR